MNDESVIKITISQFVAILLAIIIGLGWLSVIRTAYLDQDFDRRVKALETRCAEIVSDIEQKGEAVIRK